MKATILAISLAMSSVALAASAAPATPHCTVPLGSLTYSCPAARTPVARPATAAKPMRPVARVVHPAVRVVTHRIVTRRRVVRAPVYVARRCVCRVAGRSTVTRRTIYRVERGNWDRAYAQGAYNYHSASQSYVYWQAPAPTYYYDVPAPTLPPQRRPHSRYYGYNPGDGGPPPDGERLDPWANYDPYDGPENGY